MKMTYNTISLTKLASTLAKIIGIDPPASADNPIEGFQNIVDGKVDRTLIYNPDAIAMWLYQKYYTEFFPVLKHAPLCIPFQTVMPSRTPVCFATMYTGTSPQMHGIKTKINSIVKPDSLFDSLIRSGRNVALIAVEGSSMSMIYAGKTMDYFIMEDDSQVKEKAMELIRKDEYDFISVYTQEYDDAMHKTGPESPESLQALRNQIGIFNDLANAVDMHWRRHRSLVTFSTDHGVHLNEDGTGGHGTDMPEDLNICHFIGVKETAE